MSMRQRAPGQGREQGTNWVLLGLCLVGVVIVIIGITWLKSLAAPPRRVTEVAGNSTSIQQLNRALDAKLPVIVFMHSTTCVACKDMTAVMNQVYPEYAEHVVLVDVDVYDEANTPLMRQLRLQSIPTTVLFDRQGRTWQHIGTMGPEELRTQIQKRAVGG